MIKALQVLRIHLLELEKVCMRSAPINHFLPSLIRMYIHILYAFAVCISPTTEMDYTLVHGIKTTMSRSFERTIMKVQELCRDFCTRYIACLRGKMQSENLLRSDYPLEHNNNLSNSNSPVNTPDHVSISFP